MPRSYSQKTFCVGKARQLVQVARNTFELEHQFQMFATQSFAYLAAGNQLAEDFRARSSGRASQGAKFEIMRRIEPERQAVFLLAGFAQGRATTLVSCWIHR